MKNLGHKRAIHEYITCTRKRLSSRSWDSHRVDGVQIEHTVFGPSRGSNFHGFIVSTQFDRFDSNLDIRWNLSGRKSHQIWFRKHSHEKRERPLNSRMSQNDDEAILVLKRGPTDGFVTETCGCLYPKVHNNLLGVLSHATDIEMKFSRASLAFAPFFGVTTSRSHRSLTCTSQTNLSHHVRTCLIIS